MPGPKRSLCRRRIDVASPTTATVLWTSRGVALVSIEHGLDPTQCRYRNAGLAVQCRSLSKPLDGT